MTIKRIDTDPRMSDAVIHNNTLYYTGVPRNLSAGAYEQTLDTLAQVEEMLNAQGSNKSKVLDATIILADGADFAEMNRAWDSWVDPEHTPVRCTIQATLMKAEYRVEIKIIAAVD
ncbi:RidA family protein [Enterobacteriaceae bacterium BIT-l23]|jgi:enamine deaminase RidA (YjgF/YER057c/UK114 family)|uniref:RidA family protein n=1 Tax=Jejubacter calystegiae TaxID=2579935 RepID=A0A4P8YLM5_9ENTR|nr:RidA family protein [Jejubacter calystegiae]NUU68366.1 RidA family protein [Enterobacteriaceae bacterium BIT-l23]QCT21700.1 RidA family protein [Jejubacter calystegiae]